MKAEQEPHKKKEPETKIMQATPDDVLGMQEVFYKTWLATYPNEELGITVDDIEDRFKGAFTEEKLAPRRERLVNLPEGEKVFVAKENDKVVGLCRIILHQDKNQLQAIYILPEYQGKGVGKKLWEEAQQNFDQTKDTIVEVASYNTKAIEFYRRLGFIETGKYWEDENFRLKSGAIIPEIEMIIKAKQL